MAVGGSGGDGVQRQQYTESTADVAEYKLWLFHSSFELYKYLQDILAGRMKIQEPTRLLTGDETAENPCLSPSR